MRSYANTITLLMMALMLSFASPVYAQDTCTAESCQVVYLDLEGNATNERYRLPEGTRCEVDGETFQCFALDEYVQLLEMDVDLRFYSEAYPNAQEQIVSLGNVAMQLNIALDAANEQVDTLSLERVRLLANWTEENRLRLAAENRPELGSWFAWGLAAVEAIVLAILAGVIAGG